MKVEEEIGEKRTGYKYSITNDMGTPHHYTVIATLAAQTHINI